LQIVSHPKPGDVVAITDADKRVYRFAVDSIKTDTKANAPLLERVGTTPSEIVTIITDAGQPDIAPGKFTQSTVVRASILN
jgi:hypothetical protein